MNYKQLPANPHDAQLIFLKKFNYGELYINKFYNKVLKFSYQFGAIGYMIHSNACNQFLLMLQNETINDPIDHWLYKQHKKITIYVSKLLYVEHDNNPKKSIIGH